jgi:hypothetical protein
MTQQRSVIADKSFILVMALPLDLLPRARVSRDKAVRFATGALHQGEWIDAKEGRKTVCSPWQTY